MDNMDNSLPNSLPVIEIYTQYEQSIESKEEYLNIWFFLKDKENPANNVSKADLKDKIRGRGNTTWIFPKKPYRIKFDKKTSLFGLAAAENWVLLAEYLDPTLIMNMTAFKLGNVLSLPYNHTYRHIKLYLNEEYKGIYGLTEHNEVGEGRVDIDENEGWFVEMSLEYDEEPKFRTANYDLPVMIKSPKAVPIDIDNPAYDFVKKDINELLDSMASVKFPENGYRDLIDINTFIDFLLANEVVMNHELGHPKSVYLYKDKNGRISVGPLWDFDYAFSYDETTHFTTYKARSWKHSFFERFFEDPVFAAKYKDRWNEKYPEISAISEFIYNYGMELEESVAENFKMWNPSNNYAQQITNMKEWWNNRCLWLNTELNKKSF